VVSWGTAGTVVGDELPQLLAGKAGAQAAVFDPFSQRAADEVAVEVM